MTVRPAGELTWRRSKHCDGGACVQVAESDQEVLLRDSQDKDTRFHVTSGDWYVFVARIKSGEFDGL